MGVYCQIHLEKPPEGSFKPGNVVSGAVKYAIDEDTSYKDIVLCLRGKGRVSWSENDSNDSYLGDEDYVKITKSILDKKNEDEVLLKRGDYSFTFQFVLPPNIPPSYKDLNCKISYYVKLTFERKGIFNFNKTFRAEIPVASVVNVTLPGEPTMYGAQKSLITLFKSGKHQISMKATIKKSVLAPGETAELDIEVTNDSDIVISTVETQLIRNITYISRSGHTKQSLHDNQGPKTETKQPVKERCTANFVSTLKISEDEFSIQHSKILVKDNILRVKVKIPFPHTNLTLDIPVVIGDAGIENAMEMKEECSIDSESLPDEPPPSYWEVMAEDKIIEEKKK